MESELKFSYNKEFNRQVIQKLNVICLKDKEFSKNQVNSIYFDTPGQDLLMEKASSDFLKTKLRVRWYSENSQNLYFLELKHKIGSSRVKHRETISIEDKGNIFDYLNGSEFKKIKTKFINTHSPDLCGALLFPFILVSYDRERFIDKFNQYRISVDTNISAISINNKHKIKLESSILEIKGKALHSLPINLRQLMTYNLKKAAFSKYYESCVQLNHYIQ